MLGLQYPYFVRVDSEGLSVYLLEVRARERQWGELFLQGQRQSERLPDHCDERPCSGLMRLVKLAWEQGRK